MAWEVDHSPEMRSWMKSLSPRDRARIIAPIEALREQGPGLSGSLSKHIRTSRHPNMKELRSTGGHLRVLYAFGRDRRAILLLGGDKTNNWDRWYRINVPKADRILDRYTDRGGGGTWRSGPNLGR
jgi:hypothetical protein